MCTLIILHRPGHVWPLLLAGNRDEMANRPWRPPGRHWPDQPNLVAGLDELAGGSWMGINDQGTAAVVMNRVGTLGPASGKRSRGELVLQALAQTGARAAAQAISMLDPCLYRPFNLITGDHQEACWVRNDGLNLSLSPIPAGLHMLTSMELNDTRDPRIRHYLPRFKSARFPSPGMGDWDTWESLLGDRSQWPDEPVSSAMCFHREDGFGTLSSSCIALCKRPGKPERDIWRFAPGAPDHTGFAPLNL